MNWRNFWEYYHAIEPHHVALMIYFMKYFKASSFLANSATCLTNALNLIKKHFDVFIYLFLTLNILKVWINLIFIYNLYYACAFTMFLIQWYILAQTLFLITVMLNTCNMKFYSSRYRILELSSELSAITGCHSPLKRASDGQKFGKRSTCSLSYCKSSC